jgi:hypothetical protein
LPSYLKTKVDETKQFVKDHQSAITITFVVTAAASFAVCKGVHKTSEHYWRGMYKGVINSAEMSDMEHLTLLEFIDFNNLKHEFERFNIKQNNL